MGSHASLHVPAVTRVSRPPSLHLIWGRVASSSAFAQKLITDRYMRYRIIAADIDDLWQTTEKRCLMKTSQKAGTKMYVIQSAHVYGEVDRYRIA